MYDRIGSNLESAVKTYVMCNGIQYRWTNIFSYQEFLGFRAEVFRIGGLGVMFPSLLCFDVTIALKRRLLGF